MMPAATHLICQTSDNGPAHKRLALFSAKKHGLQTPHPFIPANQFFLEIDITTGCTGTSKSIVRAQRLPGCDNPPRCRDFYGPGCAVERPREWHNPRERILPPRG
jgi:hypothetical protein